MSKKLSLIVVMYIYASFYGTPCMFLIGYELLLLRAIRVSSLEARLVSYISPFLQVQRVLFLSDNGQ